MSSYLEYNMKTHDKKNITYYKWSNISVKPKGIVLILHGMAEHARRYNDIALFLNKHNLIVYAPDHRGHGKTDNDMKRIGFFDEENGWQKVVNDIKELINIIKKEYDLSLIVLGHSMGSLLARSCFYQFGDLFDGIILSGTTMGRNKLLINLGQIMSNSFIKQHGQYAQALKLDKLTFGSYNKHFRPNRTAYDWLSRDNDQVDKYVDDNLCGFICSGGFFKDMFDGLKIVTHLNNFRNINKDIPIYIFSGDKDPVGTFGKEPKKLFEMFKKLRFTNITFNLYKEGRHEMLNEINKTEVYNDIIAWIKKHIIEKKGVLSKQS